MLKNSEVKGILSKESTNTQKENLIDFLKIQHNWFIQGLGYLDTQNKTIKKSLENWNFDDIIKK
ncbi:hypothetical protein DDV84_08570 [Campylobacter jejuni]|nr:hypothetical protein DDV84_08570 [Campylobacter jejuni]